MLKVVFCAVGTLLCIAASSASAQFKGTGAFKNNLVQAQCPVLGVPAPCDPDVTFDRGFFRVKRIKEPKPVFNALIGKIRMQAVAPIQPQLDGLLNATLYYQSDPDTDCPLANSTVMATPWATSTMTCLPSADFLTSNCRGSLILSALTPVTCSDVTVIIEDVEAEVYEAGSTGNPAGLIARDGAVILGRSPDCNSGGSGCP